MPPSTLFNVKDEFQKIRASVDRMKYAIWIEIGERYCIAQRDTADIKDIQRLVELIDKHTSLLLTLETSAENLFRTNETSEI